LTTYDEAITWLYSRTRSGAERGPERAGALLEALGRPQDRFPAVHVVGTNGKGSVCAMLDVGLRAAGLRVGRFTSPALLDFRERIVVDGAEIPEDEVIEYVAWAKGAGFWGAFFDHAVALAFQHFARRGVDAAVVEAGVGGARDATMNLSRVSIVVITNVDLDHLETIGPTITDISRDKGGAMRPGVPAVTGAVGEALEVLREVAAQKGAPLLVLEDGDSTFAIPHAPTLRGAHQVANARLAAATLRLLGHEDSVEAAIGATWPARLEHFRLGGTTVIVDGAHNPAGTRALAASVEPGYHLVFGAMARKDWRSVLPPLQKGALSLNVVSPGEGGVAPEEIAAEQVATTHPSVGSAITAAVDEAGAGRVLVAGSLYLAGKARAWLLAAGAKPVP
jgi:dihydrofolate synthase/folylpolyglutamate synthase